MVGYNPLSLGLVPVLGVVYLLVFFMEVVVYHNCLFFESFWTKPNKFISRKLITPHVKLKLNLTERDEVFVM